MVLSDPELTQAVSKILLRSERVASVAELQKTYVDTGVLPQLDNDNNQILYGRRGTGKSHVLRVLGALARERSRDTLDIYIDLRFLGSTQQATDPTRPFSQRCVSLFKDFLIEVYDALLEAATDPTRDPPGLAIEEAEEFGQVITRFAMRSSGREVVRSSRATTNDDSKSGITLSKSPEFSIANSGQRSREASINETYQEVFEDSLIFSDIRKACDRAIRACGLSRLLLLIDEWTTLPPDIQPFFAEFLKRSFLPSRSVTLKIASLEYRSRFSNNQGPGHDIGFEVGGDISANLDLDDYYVYDRNPGGVVHTFQEVLYRHIASELPKSYVATRELMASPDSMRCGLFTEAATFVELVRAAEGVVRDFISIFNRAFFFAQRSARTNIDVRTVREAARQWYETDKSVNLSEKQNTVLDRIMTEVIGKKKARSFLLERRFARHPVIESLFDFRVLHITAKGYSDRDNPGIRYNIYTLDYGTYVDLLQTQSQPELDLEFGVNDVGEDRMVPFSDRRSIRRVVVGPNILESAGPD